MAMIKCKECGSDISNKAPACPKCGAKQAQTSGCAKIALAAICFVTLLFIISMCSRNNSTDNTSQVQITPSQTPSITSIQEPHDDLSLFISKFGDPDRIESSENEIPRPPIVTKRLIYDKEKVRAVYVADGEVGAPPPYNKWKLLGFQDNRTNAVLQPAEVVARLEKRRK